MSRNREPEVSTLAAALDAIGEPWGYLILQEAFFGVRRFDDFQENLGIARNTLTKRLARLVQHDLLKKRPYQKRPVRYEYRLTARGLDTYPYALSLTRWGDEHLGRRAHPPVILYHRTCGKRLRPVPVCDGCEREVVAEDVSINLVTNTDPASAHGDRVRYSTRPELYTAIRDTSVSRTLAIIGDRWGFLVLWAALAGISKFDHFHRILGVARTILAARLQRLVDEKILEKRIYRERPPRYEYYLTADGRALCPVLLTLFDWGERCFGAIGGHALVMHKSCGQSLHTKVVCSHCRQVVKPHDVRVETTSRSKTKSASSKAAVAGA